MQKILARLLRSFLQGLLILCPIGITAYLIFAIFNSVDSLVPWVPRGLGFVIIIVFVIIVLYYYKQFIYVTIINFNIINVNISIILCKEISILTE